MTDAQLSLPPRGIANGVLLTFVPVKRKIKRGPRHALPTGTSSEGEGRQLCKQKCFDRLVQFLYALKQWSCKNPLNYFCQVCWPVRGCGNMYTWPSAPDYKLTEVCVDRHDADLGSCSLKVTKFLVSHKNIKAYIFSLHFFIVSIKTTPKNISDWRCLLKSELWSALWTLLCQHIPVCLSKGNVWHWFPGSGTGLSKKAHKGCSVPITFLSDGQTWTNF